MSSARAELYVVIGRYFVEIVLYWFRQCTDLIHSVYKNKPLPNTHVAARRMLSVCCQFAVRGSCSPEQPPLTALLPCQGNGRSQRSVRSTSPDGVFDRDVPRNADDLKPLSPFVPAHRDITLESLQTGRDCPAAQIRHAEGTTNLSEPSLRTPLALPHEFYSGHAPTLRLLTTRIR